jgi:glutamyl-Q tRNA(Asp) synthetase
VGSWLDATSWGEWLLRIDDLDTPRCRPQHEHAILAALCAFGLDSADEPKRQSDRRARYAQAETTLASRLPLFHCDCTRRDLARGGEPCCARDCRRRRCDPADSALRADLRGLPVLRVLDRSLGEIQFAPQLHRDVIIRRRDGLHSYHLATVVDDADEGITDVVRGADLLPSTVWQLALQAALDLPTPVYLHLPLVVEPDGRKLAKSRHSAPLEPGRATEQLRRVLGWLGQPQPPLTLRDARSMLAWLRPRWDPARLLGLREVRLEA